MDVVSASISLHQRNQSPFRFLVTFAVHILGYNLFLPDKNLQSPQSLLALLYRKGTVSAPDCRIGFPFFALQTVNDVNIFHF